MNRMTWLLVLALVAGNRVAQSAISSGESFFVLPMSCAELLPDPAPFLGFFEAVGKGLVASDRALSRRIFRVLALREKISEEPDRVREQNPIDILIRKTLCYYREQKDPLRPIGYEDAEFVKFLNSAIKDLESKIDDTIFQWEFERAQRVEYKRQLERNRGVVDSLRKEAANEASREFERLSGAARRKVHLQDD